MNAVRPVRMQPERAVTFKAWRGDLLASQQALEIQVEAETIDEALDRTVFQCQHKDGLFVLRSDAGKRESTLYVYLIQEGQAGYRKNASTGLTERYKALKPKPIAAFKVDAFDPTRPFDAFRDPAHGRDLTLVEA